MAHGELPRGGLAWSPWGGEPTSSLRIKSYPVLPVTLGSPDVSRSRVSSEGIASVSAAEH
ncbi:hypothetical protein D187_005747 [Cystobacter fuscus DSM 2262]|uniref:Uncharacterized protein n=1 Tax=Cystobacter fuscus (strain ATCC 25194 / DSM 2262 / NBRC 100088 / M29) TaxID=1242864 RepID=S9PJU3_CYSF2|nr:hypothetical protein D187_005747 [Cystobacter fuscus DSM 2262]